MALKIYTILIILLLAAIISLAGVFYWQTGKPPNQTSGPNSPNQINKLPQSSENEILPPEQTATTTPNLQSMGEISRGNPNKKQIIFTFDAGAGTNSAQKILEVAKKHNVKITFFITGKFAERNPELIKQIAADGHEIFNHTYSHPHLPQLTGEQIKEELNQTEQVISNLTSATTKPYFRPPYKDRDERVLKIAQELGYQSAVWTIDALDWLPDKTEEEVKQKILGNLKNGAIILMHVGDNITGDILDEVFTNIENQGYKIVNLTEGLKP